MTTPRQQRRQFDQVARLLTAIHAEMLRHADRVREGATLSPSIHHALDVGGPAIFAQWAGLRHAQRYPQAWTTGDLGALIQTLHVDARALLAVLRGDLVLTAVRDN